jgi:hypothetical protein
MVFHIGEMELSTDLVGDSSETSLKFLLPNLAVLLIDDLGFSSGVGKEVAHSSVAAWKVCH